MPNDAIERLIEAALNHAARLRHLSDGDACEAGADVTRKEADQWEAIALKAKTALERII
jgi:hypothetical protein